MKQKHPLALVYSGEGRDNGTPFYFRATMARMGVPFNWYWPQAPVPEGHAFYWVVDDGRDELNYRPPHPCGFYATDTHLGWDVRRRKAEHFDIIWCAQKDAAEKMQADGLNAKWVPLACCPEAHPAMYEITAIDERRPPKYDIGFVGHLQPPNESNRVQFLDEVFREFPNSRLAFGVFHRDMARVYHQCRIGLNHAVREDLNMRFFELASLGVPQLCDRRMIGLAELGFIEGKHYIGYSNSANAIVQAKRWLADDCAYWMGVMAEDALQLVRSAHTYAHRVTDIMYDIQKLTGEGFHDFAYCSLHGIDPSTWPATWGDRPINKAQAL